MKNRIIRIAIALVMLTVLIFPVKQQYRDGGTITYTSLIYKIIVWHTALSETMYKAGTEYYLFPDNFHDLEYYLSNSKTNVTEGYIIGEMTVSSGGRELIAFRSWDHGFSDGASGDAMQIMGRGIEDKLETIEYADDFSIVFTESPWDISYMVYKDDFYTHDDNTALESELKIPEEPGIYIIRVQATWGNTDDNTAYDYVFRLLVN